MINFIKTIDNFYRGGYNRINQIYEKSIFDEYITIAFLQEEGAFGVLPLLSILIRRKPAPGKLSIILDKLPAKSV